MLSLDNVIIKEDLESIFASRSDWKELDNKAVYVTGSTGMIASYLILFLIYLNEIKNYNITILAGIRNIEKARGLFGLYLNKNYFKKCTNNILDSINDDIEADYIIHAASLASPQFYGKMPVETILPNVVATYRILEYAKLHNINGVLFLSSGDIYGTLVKEGSIYETDIGILNHLDVGSFYGESKRCGESLCKAYYLEHGVPVKFARIAHTYGPTMDWENDKRVFSEFVKNILNNENIVMKSDGSAKRPFCYITDNISGLFKILLDGENGEAYNVGNDKEFISIRELAEKLVALFPERVSQIVCANRNDDSYKPCTELKVAVMSMDKLRALGWEPIITVEDGFKRTVDAIIESAQIRNFKS